jgi:hypothetical protein
MRRAHTRELLPPAVTRAVKDVLRSPATLSAPEAQSQGAVLPERLPVTSPGEQAEQEARQAVNPRDLDFTRVRVHADQRAGESARAVGARAYAVGKDIVFGPGEFRPHREEGRRLLAHELAHTRQPGAAERLARDPVAGYETKSLDLDRANIEAMATGSYWEQKIVAQFDLIYMNAVQSRLQQDAEERDAVLSSLWQHRPQAKVQSDTVISASIPQRPNVTASKQVLYQFTFTPPAPGSKLDGAKIELKAEGGAAAVAKAPPPPSSYTPPSLSASSSGFPEGRDKYFKAHPDEQKQLYSWIDNAPAQFNQIVTTGETTTGGKKHDSSFQVKGAKDTSGKLTSLDIDLLSESPTFIDTPPAGYASKDRTDLELEKQQAKASDKLGTVSGLSAVPADEQLSVKYVIWQYFNGGTRNKEVDVIIPIARKTVRVFYTLRFEPTNNVNVERVGDEDSSATLKTEGLNIARVEGFAANSTDAAAFSAWIKLRYPSVALSGTSLTDLQNSVNADMAANAGTSAWFWKNYNIEILDDAGAATRLKTVHKRVDRELVGLKTFSADELKRLEFALETMSDAELKILRSVRFARQSVFQQISGSVVTPKPAMGGWTWQAGSESTVLIFDSAKMHDRHLFVGGAGGVRPASVETYVHELGHVLGGQNKIEESFKDFVKKKGIKPVTGYAASKPATESFPEAFALYQSDPEWMKNNLPDLFTWFEAVKKTGSPP